MVVMSIETYEKMNMDYIVYEKLKEAVIAAESTDERYDFEQVSKEMREKLIEKL